MDRHFTQFYGCVTCTKWFNSKLSLMRHKSQHSDFNSQLIRKLRRKYLTYFKYRLRWKSIHAHNFYRNRYTCLECRKSFITTSAVESHMKMCHLDDEYKCLFCSEKYGNYSELMTHTLQHADERPYCCYVCRKAFVSLTDLTKHEKSHSDKSYKCCVCDKKYSKVTDLERHSRIHSDLFLCKICGKGFCNRYSLSQHLGKADRSLPPCKMCGFKFTARCERRPHLKSHLDNTAASYSQVTDLPSCDQTVENNCSAKENDNLGVPFRKSICIEQSHLSASEMFENLCDSNTDVSLSEGGHIDTESLGADMCDEANTLLPDTQIEKYVIKSLDGEISPLANDICNTNTSSHISERNGVTNMHTNSISHTIEVQEKINILDANKSLPENLFKEIKLGVKRRLLAEKPCSDEIKVKTFTTVRPLTKKSDAVNKRRRGQKRDKCQYCGERIRTKRSHHYARCHDRKAIGSDQLMTFSVRELPSDTLSSSVAYHCYICNKSFKSNAGLGSHRQIHISSITSINEPSGSAAADTTSSVSLSEQQMKSDCKKYLCCICNMSFESEAAFSSHKKLHMNIEINSSDRDGVISHCDTFRKSRFGSNKVYRTVADAQTKIRRLPSKDKEIKHLMQKTRIVCTVCKEVFCYKETFEVHAILHEKAGWNICNDCGKCFIKRTSLRSHQRKKHCKIEKKLSKNLAGDLYEKDQNSKGASNPSLDKEQDDGIEFRKSLRCSVCKISFSKESYKAHVCANEETVWFVCWVCGKSYCTARNLKKHQEQKHPNSKFLFSDKKSKLKNINVIKKRNVKVCALKLKGKYERPLCKKRFDSQKSIGNHVVLHRKKTKSMYHKHGMTKLSRGQNKKMCLKEKRKKIICSVCERIFYVKEYFETHIKSHKEAAMHFCLECGKSYAAKSCLVRHTKLKHSQSSTRVVRERFSGLKNIIPIASQKKNESLSCLECGKSYTTKAYLVRHHKQKHNQNSNSVVNEGLSGIKNTSIDHTAAHKAMGLLTCLDCGKSYTTKSSLVKHCRKKHQRSNAEVFSKDIETKNIIGEKIEIVDINPALQKSNSNKKEVNKCPVCRRKYDCKETFKNHVLIHEKSDWYICYHCSLCFWKKSILVEHLRTFHSENCMQPETKTAIQNNEDMLIDSDGLQAKEYKCSVCSSSYTFKVIFKNHVLLHEKEGWYVCCECGNSYLNKSSLDQHWVNNHLDIVRSAYDLEAFWKKTYGIVLELNVKIKLMNPCSRCGEFYGDSRRDYQRHIITCCKGEMVKIETKLQHGYNDCNSVDNCKNLAHKRRNKNGINCNVCKQSFLSKRLLSMHLKISSTCRLDPDDEVEKTKSGDGRNLVNTRIFPERGVNAILECNEENSGIGDAAISYVQTDVGNACVSNRNSPFICESETGKSKKKTHEFHHCGSVFSSFERLNYHTRIFNNQSEIFYSKRNHVKMLLSGSANDKEMTERILTECEGSCVNNGSDLAVMKENLPEPEIPSVMNISDKEDNVENLCMSVLPSVTNHNAKERTEEILKECLSISVWDPPILTSAMESVEDLIPRKTQKASAISIHKGLVFKENLSAFDDQKLGESEELCDKINAYPYTGKISVSLEPPVTYVRSQEKEFAYGDNKRNVSKTRSSELNSENCYRKNAEVKTMATENYAMPSMEFTVAQNSCSKSTNFQQTKEHTDVKIPAECGTSISGSNFGSSCTATRINECNKVLKNEKIFFKTPSTVDLQPHQKATLHFDEISHASTMTDLSLEELLPVTPQFKETSTALTVVDPYPGDFAGTDKFLKKSDKEILPTEKSSPKTVVVLPGLKERSKESFSADLLQDKLVLFKPSEERNGTASDAGSSQNFRKDKIPCTVNQTIFPLAARNTKSSRGPVKGSKVEYSIQKQASVFRVRRVSDSQLSSNKQELPKKVLSSGTPRFIPKICPSSEVSKPAAKSPYMTKVDQSLMSINRNPVSEVRSEVSCKKLFNPAILKKKNSSNNLINSGLVGIHHIAEEKLKLNLTSKKSAIVTPLHYESRPASQFFKESVQAPAFSESQVKETASLNVVNFLSEQNMISSSSGDLTTTSVNIRKKLEGRCLPISDDLLTKIIPPRKTSVPTRTCYMIKEGNKFYLINKFGSSSQGIVQESLKRDKEEVVFCMPGLVQDEIVNAKPFLVTDTPSKPGPLKIKIFTNSQHK